MKEITTVGLDLAKNVFQVHGVDAEGAVVVRRQVKRAQVLLFFSRLRPCIRRLDCGLPARPDERPREDWVPVNGARSPAFEV
ncbi:hypothetical protein C8J28_12525 [Cereibacter azotoformans]|uniref:Transposase n=1 Tax=Cereibacter azotoformans TaxID=43057 RepID=A0A2T5JSV9_9RHOB|nr:hypothetical protein [Cereibacter azotoformans]PTR12066.1 hypothetical protein C8J28_12525 [Cereibacter azotoformans]